MFLAEVVAVNASEKYLDEKTDAFDMAGAGLISYIHGKYYGSTEPLGKFGYSVQKSKSGTGEDSQSGEDSTGGTIKKKPRWTAKRKNSSGKKRNRKK